MILVSVRGLPPESRNNHTRLQEIQRGIFTAFHSMLPEDTLRLKDLSFTWNDNPIWNAGEPVCLVLQELPEKFCEEKDELIGRIELWCREHMSGLDIEVVVR